MDDQTCVAEVIVASRDVDARCALTVEFAVYTPNKSFFVIWAKWPQLVQAYTHLRNALVDLGLQRHSVGARRKIRRRWLSRPDEDE